MAGTTFHEDARWGDALVDPNERSLPGLKARFLVDHAPSSGAMLDVGCGEGKLLRTLARERPGLALHGCDIRVPQRAPDVFTFTKVEGDALPYEDGSFTAAMLFDVLEHVPDPAAMLRETGRVLAPGGRLVAFVPVEGEALSFYRVFRALLGDDVYVETKDHIQAFSHAAIAALVDGAFVRERTAYAYHLAGHAMDAAFFAAQKLRTLRDFWWKKNTFYVADAPSSGGATSVMNGALRLANRLAYHESALLHGVRATSAGLLVAARKR